MQGDQAIPLIGLQQIVACPSTVLLREVIERHTLCKTLQEYTSAFQEISARHAEELNQHDRSRHARWQ